MNNKCSHILTTANFRVNDVIRWIPYIQYVELAVIRRHVVYAGNKWQPVR